VRDVDETDLRLVRYLLNNPRASYAEVARATGVSETTARRRVDALIEDRVITPAMIPDVRRLGFETLALVGIKLDLNHLNETAERIRELSSVTSLHMTMGRYELIATITQPTLDDLRRFLVEQIAPLPGICDTEVFVSTKALKILRDWRLPEGVEFGQPVRRIQRNGHSDSAGPGED
jgi:Lrp/AsnC family transcriptional regulator, regulator for asnA, asnC and gidA